MKRKRKISRSDGGDGDMLMHTRWQRASSADRGADKRGGEKDADEHPLGVVIERRGGGREADVKSG